jgi:hypothetical protein
MILIVPTCFASDACLGRVHFLRERLIEQAICCSRPSQWDIIGDGYNGDYVDLRCTVSLSASVHISEKKKRDWVKCIF